MMYTKILAALDGSRLAESILPYARLFANALNIPVELLRVIDPDTLIPSIIAQHGRFHDILSVEREHATNYLKKVATSFSEPAAVDCSVRIGKVAEVIVEVAEALPGTLIAMSTHGRSGIKRWFLGSVVEKVLRAGTNHLLLIRAPDESKKIEALPLKRVIVPLDGSKLAETVIPHAVDLARKTGLEIVLVRVFSLPTPLYTAEQYTANLQDLWEQIKKEAQEYLEEKVKELQKDGLERVSTVLLEGSAADQIIELARKEPETLVVICTHGRSGVGRWVLGSVTERVVRHSGDPVLVIRATSACPA